jgi:hypothetical protein
VEKAADRLVIPHPAVLIMPNISTVTRNSPLLKSSKCSMSPNQHCTDGSTCLPKEKNLPERSERSCNSFISHLLCQITGVFRDWYIGLKSLSEKGSCIWRLSKHQCATIVSFLSIEHAMGGMKHYNILVHTFRNRIEHFEEDVLGICAGLWNLVLSY